MAATTDLLALTADLVNRPSVSFAEAPFVDWLEDELGALAHLETIRVGDNLVARTNLGRKQRLLLVGHTDTVPVNNNGEARIDQDRLWGVGSCDMKSGLAVFIELARSVPNPIHDLTFIFYAREEVAQEHNGLGELLEVRPELLAGDCAVLGEPTSAGIEAGCQGAMRLEVVLRGARAHTARPWMGRNAIHRLADLLAALASYEARTPTIDGCTYKESVQAVSVEGGVAGNVVPDEVTLRIHYRFAPDRTADEAESFMRSLLAPHLEDGDRCEVVDLSLACPPSLDHVLLKELIDVNGLPVAAKLGWTDVARFASIGVPAANFGPGDPTIAHTQGEYVDRDSIDTVYKALYALIAGV